MAKSFPTKLTLSFLALFIVLLIVLYYFGGPTAQSPATPAGKPPAAEATSPPIKTSAQPSDIVAKIGDYVITRQELVNKLKTDINPAFTDYTGEAKTVDAKTVLLEMIAEKAMAIEGREKNYLQNEKIRKSLKKFREKTLVNLLLTNHLKGKINVTEAEIDKRLKTAPNLSRPRAKAMLERAKADRLIIQLLNQICTKLRLQFISDNFPKAARIYQRLLNNSADTYHIKFVRFKQVRENLTPQEKNMVLAAYYNGKVTLKDLFDALGEFSPPSRPTDLNTPAGIKRFLLDSVLKTPIFVTEALSRGFDKDEIFLKQLKERQEKLLRGHSIRERLKSYKKPTEQQVIEYFNKNKEQFGIPPKLRIDQIWCQDLKAAQKAKAELDAGADFQSVKLKYSLQKKDQPFDTYPAREAIFFNDLAKAEPNEIIGPIKGFHQDGVKWRIVKMFGKKPPKLKEYSNKMKRSIERKIYHEQTDAILAEYRKQLLEKYPYQIYNERIADIDPFDIP